MIVEATTYRVGGHFYGDVGAYRPADEFGDYRDPLDVLRRYVSEPAVDRPPANRDPC